MSVAIVRLVAEELGHVSLLANPNVTVAQAETLVNALQPFFPGAVIDLFGVDTQLTVRARTYIDPLG